MISIIISSYQPKLYERLINNIELTCGVEYEIIKIDNPGLLGISEAYNIGGDKAKYSYLVFIHEDILFHTLNWGNLLINHLNQKNVGIIGSAGSSYVSSVPSSWYLVSNDYIHANFIQNNKEANLPRERKINLLNKRNKVFKLDGMFLGMNKKVFQKYRFNENFQKYDGYDTDISLRVGNDYDNYVIDDVLIEHFSGGVLTKDWLEAHIYISENVKYLNQFVCDEDIETDMFIFFLENNFNCYGVSFKVFFKSLRYFPRNISIRNFFKIFKFSFKKMYNNLKFRSLK